MESLFRHSEQPPEWEGSHTKSSLWPSVGVGEMASAIIDPSGAAHSLSVSGSSDCVLAWVTVPLTPAHLQLSYHLKGSEEPDVPCNYVNHKLGIITGLTLIMYLASFLPVPFRRQQKPACISSVSALFC